MAGFFWWFIIGGTVGALASHWFPARAPRDMTMTMILGLVGAVLGGVISTQLFGSDPRLAAFDAGNLALSTAGALLAVAAYMLFTPIHGTPQELPRR